MGIIAAKNVMDPAEFWREYEVRFGEQVHSYTLGRYLRGWNEYDAPLWGLLIATSGGFRFHHFPHEGWIEAISRTTSGGAAPTEKLIFIPKERIVSAELRFEKSWWRKLLFAQPPLLIIRYRDVNGTGEPIAELIAETEKKAETLVRHLTTTMLDAIGAHFCC
ncbi:MAG: hypothetical protein LBT14_12500 [Treponema sp.]|jgi:hypothetical protein|nr:hypothetical protein [Treponema sp.]